MDKGEHGLGSKREAAAVARLLKAQPYTLRALSVPHLPYPFWALAWRCLFRMLMLSGSLSANDALVLV